MKANASGTEMPGQPSDTKIFVVTCGLQKPLANIRVKAFKKSSLFIIASPC
jgi:hypothetical protein